uniref:Ig-like domain-containing protein n=1 Tax=Lates calcarifer TaxID=8187 RepID=A0A4W6DXB4_LATCA
MVHLNNEMANRHFTPAATLMFILLFPTQSSPDQRVIGPPQPIAAVVGDDITLPCHLEPAMSASDKTVEWTRSEFVHVHEDGRLLHEIQNPSYYYRTRLFVDELEHGNVSMKIFEVKLSDEGTYRCSLPVVQEEVFVQLIVGKLVQNSESLRNALCYRKICESTVFVIVRFCLLTCREHDQLVSRA